MKIPKEIVGIHKLRDLYICELYINGKDGVEIAEFLSNDSRLYYRLKPRRIQKILEGNSVYINKYIGWPKSKRIHMLQRIAENAGMRLSPSKDVLNVMEQLRKEIEGDKATVDQSTNITITRFDESKRTSTRLPRQHPQVPTGDTEEIR